MENEYIKTQESLYAPTQVAVRNPENITRMGDARIYSLIVSQCEGKSRLDDVEVWEYIERNNILEDDGDGILLNIEIKYIHQR